MKKLFKDYRYWIAGMIGGIGFLLIIAEPIDDDGWLKVMLWSKAVGFTLSLVSALLFKHWVKKINIDE